MAIEETDIRVNEDGQFVFVAIDEQGNEHKAGLDAGQVDIDSLNNGGPISDGDGTERQIWVIANGASDPSEADNEDIIFEEES